MALISTKNLFSKRLFAHALYRTYPVRSVKCDVNSVRQIGSSGGLSNTTLILQNGVHIQELPLVVKKITGKDASLLWFSDRSSNGTSGEINNSSSGNSCEIPEEDELREIIDGFSKCNSSNQVLRLLEVVPSIYVDSSVAFRVLLRLVEIENTNTWSEQNPRDSDTLNNFTRIAVFNQLINVILSGNNPDVILHCLMLMNQDSVFKENLAPYFEKIKDLILLFATEKKYNIDDICNVINEFHKAGITSEIDKLWVVITEEFAHIDENNVIKVFRTLPYFNISRNVIIDTLRRKMFSVWWNLSAQDVAEILSITEATNTSSDELLQVLARWLNTKIHSVSEDELLSIINNFRTLGYANSQINDALERYVKIKGMQIKNANLFANIMEYCLSFGIRSTPILDKCCDYFIKNGPTLPVSSLQYFITPFGYFNYSPNRSHEYWKSFEEVMKHQFIHLHPEHVLDIFLSCVYIEKFPLNFVNDVFNLLFLTRLQTECNDWEAVKTKLKIFDQAMTLECSSYHGPLLCKTFESSSATPNEDIKLFVKTVGAQILRVAGLKNTFFFKSPRSDVAPHSLLQIDVLISKYQNQSCDIALLFHPPKHYIGGEDRLIGPEILRRRLLQKLGYRVIDLNMTELAKLRTNSRLFIKHITNRIEEVL